MQKFINNWSAVLNQPLNTTDTIVFIDTASYDLLNLNLESSDYYILTLDDGKKVETLKAQPHDSGRLFVERAQENTQPNSWKSGTKLEARLTAKSLHTLQSLLDNILTVEGEVLMSTDGDVLFVLHP